MSLLALVLIATPPASCSQLGEEALGYRNDAVGSMISGSREYQVANSQQALVWYVATALACKAEGRPEDAAKAASVAKEMTTELDQATGAWTATDCARRRLGVENARKTIVIMKDTPRAPYLLRGFQGFTNVLRAKCPVVPG